jgi:RND family efflux transporter MFP subunit
VSEDPREERAQLLRELRIDRPPARAPRARARVLAWVALAVVALAGGGLWLAWSDPPAVRTAVARPAGEAAPAGSVLDASGYVTARRQATVSAKITGKVVEVPIEEGMRVEEGAVLARLDPTEAQAQLALARAQLEAARSQLHEIRAQLEQAERDYARQSELAQRQLVSAQSLDAALAQRDTFRARLGSAGEQIRVAQESVTVAQVQLDNTVVRAPFSGVVVAKTAQPGEMISPVSAGGGFTRTGIGTIVDMDSLEFQVDVNEAFINRVTPRQQADGILNAYPDWRIPAEVIAIIPTADRSKATVKVRLAIKAKDPRIAPDMGVRVAFFDPASGRPGTRAAAAGVLVPVDAIRASGGGAGEVFVYKDGRAGRRAVTLGTSTSGQHQVLSGVNAGERVILSPPAALRDGDPVKPREGS